jgi:polar amino acid transport system substrate-binding protein
MLGQVACNSKGSRVDAAERADTSMATPAPSRASSDTPPAGAAQPAKPSNQAATGKGLKVSKVEYEGWRQYSANCARCHGQDVLPNPVAANLLVSLGPGGPFESAEKFLQVVSEGRPERGMPPFKNILTPDQINAIYAYVKGRAEGRIPPGRPERPEA